MESRKIIGGVAQGERLALLGQLFRYAISGGLASIVNIGVYHVLAARFAFDPNLAWTLGFVAAMLVGYVIHSRWSFRGHGSRDNVALRGGRYVIVALVSFSVNSFWVWLLVQMFLLPLWAPYPFALCVTPLLVFTLNRYWVFR